MLVHCGDLTGPEVVSLCAILPCYFVFGNHDSDTVPLLQRTASGAGAECLGWGGTVELAGKRVGVAHGHMTTDLRQVLAAHPDYLLTGHSHIRGDRRDGPVRRINPGALSEADEFSVALLDLVTDKLRFLVLRE
ncbi:MAG: metallophosphoesterase [Gemmataceae bacterium]|nr:metallophosphoesterase [Gemmataceae bacterium]